MDEVYLDPPTAEDVVRLHERELESLYDKAIEIEWHSVSVAVLMGMAMVLVVLAVTGSFGIRSELRWECPVAVRVLLRFAAKFSWKR